MQYNNDYTPEQAQRLKDLMAEHHANFPLEKIPTCTRWRCLVLPIMIRDTIDVSKFKALQGLNQGKGLLKHEGAKRAEAYNRAHGHVVAIGDMYGHYHAPVVITDYEEGVPTGQRAVFPRTPTAMPEIGDHVVLGKWSGQYLEASHPDTGETLKFKLYNDDEILAVIDDDVIVKTKTNEEISFVHQDGALT